MANQVNAILINQTDNVATAITDLSQGESGRYWEQGKLVEITVTDKIPQYHKFAVCAIQRAGWVRKYGEVIGQAMTDIRKGAHVHVHNIASPGRLIK
jgi:altronate dehydratase